MVAATVVAHERPAVVAALGGQCTVLAATAARVYRCRGPAPLKWDGPLCTGILVLAKESSSGLAFKLISFGESPIVLDKGRVEWEQRLYRQMEYRIESRPFHSFEIEGHGQIGLLFANEDEARLFASAVHKALASHYWDTDGESVSSSSRSNGNTSKRDKAQKKQKSTKKGFFASLFGGGSRKEQSDSESEITTVTGASDSKLSSNQSVLLDTSRSESIHSLREEDIGDPTDFRHLSHIGFNPRTGAFDVKNIPAEWGAIFRKAGVTQEQLESADTARFIADFCRKNARDNGGKTATNRKKAPVPPPKRSGKSAPPPPPPKKGYRPMEDTTTHKGDANDASSLDDAPAMASREASTRNPLPMDNRADLLASIRGGAKLKSASGSTTSLGTTAATSGSDSISAAPPSGEDQGDLMAGMLAKALAARNRRLAHSDSEDE